jgi:signal transduction histidine kinase
MDWDKMDYRPLVHFLKRQSRLARFIYAILLVAVIALLDYLTGYEVSFYPFYSIPICLLVYAGDTRAALAFSLISALTWAWVDSASGHVYSQEWLRLWDTIVRLMFFCLVVAACAGLMKTRDADRAHIDLLVQTARLEQEIIQISERAQQRLGQDLHDGLCQYLASLEFTAVSLRNELERESSKSAKAAADLAATLEEAVIRARDLARGLSPVDPDEGGLESALERLAATNSRLLGVPCDFIGSASEIAIDPDVALDFYRIAQEAMNNAAKHSRSPGITIALETSPEEICLRVSDSGIGLPKKTGPGGMGMNIMRYRAKTIGATLEFLPNTPSGTVVSCVLNLSHNPASPLAPAAHG